MGAFLYILVFGLGPTILGIAFICLLCKSHNQSPSRSTSKNNDLIIFDILSSRKD